MGIITGILVTRIQLYKVFTDWSTAVESLQQRRKLKVHDLWDTSNLDAFVICCSWF